MKFHIWKTNNFEDIKEAIDNYWRRKEIRKQVSKSWLWS